METPTIKKIKDCIPNIEDNLVTFRKYFKEQNTDLEATLYGDETEYSVDGIVAGVKNIISDMRFLTNSHNLFIKLSTLSERNQIVTELESIKIK